MLGMALVKCALDVGGMSVFVGETPPMRPRYHRYWGGFKVKVAHLAHCTHSATIQAFSRTGDPYFVILGASLFPLA